jgi:hypothetical protein
MGSNVPELYYDTDMSSESPKDEGRVEKFLRKNVKKSLLFLGGLAVASVLLPPAGAAIATGLAAGSGAEALGSKILHGHLKQSRLTKKH